MNAVLQTYSAIPSGQPRAWGGPPGRARIRATPEDFQVYEVPLATPEGEGEHVWLHVRKRNSNTPWVATQLAAFAGVRPSAVSYAGLKDRHAVTEQWFSVHLPGRSDPDWGALVHEDFRVLEAQRHTRKLKTGALRGNRFRIRLRDVTAGSDALHERLHQIRQGGFPNYFGVQRFGSNGDNLEEAARLFRQPRRRLPRARRGIYLSAVRAALFNRVLAARVRAGLWNTVIPGDALQLDGRSACFVAGAPDNETLARVQALELHPTGPLCGDGEPLCTDAALALECEQLRGHRDWIEGLCRAGLAAARRALRAPARELHWCEEADGSWLLEFCLPAGSYATTLLGELVATGEST